MVDYYEELRTLKKLIAEKENLYEGVTNLKIKEYYEKNIELFKKTSNQFYVKKKTTSTVVRVKYEVVKNNQVETLKGILDSSASVVIAVQGVLLYSKDHFYSYWLKSWLPLFELCLTEDLKKELDKQELKILINLQITNTYAEGDLYGLISYGILKTIKKSSVYINDVYLNLKDYLQEEPPYIVFGIINMENNENIKLLFSPDYRIKQFQSEKEDKKVVKGKLSFTYFKNKLYDFDYTSSYTGKLNEIVNKKLIDVLSESI